MQNSHLPELHPIDVVGDCCSTNAFDKKSRGSPRAWENHAVVTWRDVDSSGGDYLSAEGDEAWGTNAETNLSRSSNASAKTTCSPLWQIVTRRYCSTFERFSVVKQDLGLQALALMYCFTWIAVPWNFSRTREDTQYAFRAASGKFLSVSDRAPFVTLVGRGSCCMLLLAPTQPQGKKTSRPRILHAGPVPFWGLACSRTWSLLPWLLAWPSMQADAPGDTESFQLFSLMINGVNAMH